jgi:hypothetical protein
MRGEETGAKLRGGGTMAVAGAALADMRAGASWPRRWL